jgi:subfamily B ATP-binding cassette protein HlyB/CyaB
LPFDPALLLQRYPAPHSLRQLIEALGAFGFRTGEGDVAKAAFPCIGFVAGDKPQPAILVKRDAERLLYFVAGSQTPQTAPAASLKELFEPGVILIQRETAAEPAAGDGAPSKSEFGFRWFWAEFLKHKRIWRDVLAASLFIQLIGLATPLGTQVVIDKVVVHQTESTPIAIAVGLGMFLLFNAAMGWLRQSARVQGAGRIGRAGAGGRQQPLPPCAGHAGLKRISSRHSFDHGIRAQPRAEGLARSRK